MWRNELTPELKGRLDSFLNLICGDTALDQIGLDIFREELLNITDDLYYPITKLKRPVLLPSRTRIVKTGCGNMFVTLVTLDGYPFEVFGTLGKSGQCAKAWAQGLTTCISTGLRHGVPIGQYVRMLEGIYCPSAVWDNGVNVRSCPDAIAIGIKLLLGMEVQNHDTVSARLSGTESTQQSGTPGSVPQLSERRL